MADIKSVVVGSTTVGANYLKAAVTYPNSSSTAANPFSQFGTRELAWYKVTSCTGVGTNPGNADSVFAQALRGVANVAELFYAYATAANVLIIAIADNTNEGGGVGNTANDVTLKEAIDAATGLTTTVGSKDSGVFATS